MSTTLTTSKAMPPGRYGLWGILKSEWTKLRTVRSTRWTLGATVVVGIALTVLATSLVRAHWSTMSPSARASFDGIGSSLIGVYFGQLTIGVLGVLAMSAEYGSGTIRATLCASPRRPMVLAAKVLVFGFVALATAEVVAFSSFFIGQTILTAPVHHATIESPDALRAVAGGGLYLCVIGLLGLGLATIIRHTAGAISAFVGILFLFPAIVAALPSSINNDIARYGLLRIGAATISSKPLSNTFSPWVGLAVLGAYAALALIVGGVLLVRRDAA